MFDVVVIVRSYRLYPGFPDDCHPAIMFGHIRVSQLTHRPANNYTLSKNISSALRLERQQSGDRLLHRWCRSFGLSLSLFLCPAQQANISKMMPLLTTNKKQYGDYWTQLSEIIYKRSVLYSYLFRMRPYPTTKCSKTWIRPNPINSALFLKIVLTEKQQLELYSLFTCRLVILGTILHFRRH